MALWRKLRSTDLVSWESRGVYTTYGGAVWDGYRLTGVLFETLYIDRGKRCRGSVSASGSHIADQYDYDSDGQSSDLVAKIYISFHSHIHRSAMPCYAIYPTPSIDLHKHPPTLACPHHPTPPFPPSDPNPIIYPPYLLILRLFAAATN